MCEKIVAKTLEENARSTKRKTKKTERELSMGVGGNFLVDKRSLVVFWLCFTSHATPKKLHRGICLVTFARCNFLKKFWTIIFGEIFLITFALIFYSRGSNKFVGLPIREVERSLLNLLFIRWWGRKEKLKWNLRNFMIKSFHPSIPYEKLPPRSSTCFVDMA